jgi:hypothetical protein
MTFWKAGKMIKGYIRDWRKRKEEDSIKPKMFGRPTDVSFDHRPEKALWWPSREDAERDINMFEDWQIVIPSSQGGTYVCKDFQAEELSPGKVAIFCWAPFLPPRPEGYPKP